MDTNRFTSTVGGLRTVFAHWVRIQQGNRNSTDFTKQATCNESLPRKNEHKELLFSVGPVLLLDHLEVPYIQIDSPYYPVLFTFKWSGYWSRPLKQQTFFWDLTTTTELLCFEWSPPWHFKTACWHHFCLKLLSRDFCPTNYPNHLFHLAGHCACQSVKQDINMSVGHVK